MTSPDMASQGSAQQAVEEAAACWREDELQALVSRDALIDAVKAANMAGASEYQLAESAGVTRMTIRAWLGKR